ncbi:transporter suffix domain-containing protein [Cohnella suwonensis]|uniref:Transporter suffix domain-containing protein n=1 Tax=Cohnella suwonensis TaxID=696072 RepID=A0ABW0LTU5_9BACL
MANRKKMLYKLGIGFIIASLLLWVVPFVVPFAPMSAKTKAGIITVALIVAEVLFWLGVLLVGKEVAKKIRGYINPRNWRKRAKKEGEGS